MNEVSYTDFQQDDLEWVLQAMIESLKATLTPERLAQMDQEKLKADTRADFERFHFSAKKPEKAIIAWIGGMRVGFVWVTMDMPVHSDEHSAWLLDVYVVPELRRQGLGRQLMGMAEEWAKGHGAKDLWLNVGGGNVRALGLYEAQGFRVETMHLCKKL